MADNTTLNSGTGGDVIATDDIAGVKHQQVKIEFGADGTATPVSSSDPLPVSLASVPSHAVTNAGTFAVQASSVVPGTAATNLGKAIDSAAGATDTGVAALVLRDDSLSALTPADGDYTHLRTDANGALWVHLNSSSATVTNAGTFAVQDSEKLADDAAFTIGTTKVQPAGFLADDTAPDSVDEGDTGAARMSLDRKQYVIAHLETSSLYQAGTARTPANAIIDHATSGDNTLLAAQGAGNKIRVLSYVLVAAGTVNVRFESGAGGTALTGQMNLVANTGVSSGYNPHGHFETAANTLLNLELSAAVSVDGHFTYVVVT